MERIGMPRINNNFIVLILIIMEDTHGEVSWPTMQEPTSLNPYYNGRYSWRRTGRIVSATGEGLNPYYNGRYSWSHVSNVVLGTFAKVLILIIMEDTHGESRHISP